LKLQIKINGNTYDAEVEILDEVEGQFGSGIGGAVSADGQPIPAPGAYMPGQTADVHSPDEKQYRSPVTGMVVKVNVAPGQKVEANDVLVVIEAMKMEMKISAHHAGKVKCVNVAAGNSVKSHQVLVELE
jgi:biotin carboxyl carrier protein